MTKEVEYHEVEDHVNQRICMICVWAVQRSRVEQGRLLCKVYGVHLSEDEVYAIAKKWRENWQIDKPRNYRGTCFLCNRTLPPEMEALCRCFREVEVGRFLEPADTQEIESLIKDYGPNLIVETIQCKDCRRLSSITLGILLSRYKSQENRGRTPVYTTPKRCQPCYVANGSRKGNVVTNVFSTVGEAARHRSSAAKGGRSKRTSDYPKPVD